MMDTLNKGSKLADKQMAMIRELRSTEDKQFEKIMDKAVKNPPKPPPPDSGATMTRGKIWPVGGRISQNFGGVSWAAYAGRTWNGTYYPHFHNGLDIAAPLGTPIKAYDGGQVNFVGMSNGYGMNVVLAHPGGLSSRYGHMLAGNNAPPLKNGQYVNAGQTVGFIGMTGFTTGPHLHFIVRDAKDYLSPITVLPKGK
jgi:murein DD-endopeptidase MepM/ murein hydrolase activator NlpD